MSHSNQQIFSNSSNITILGGQFSNVQGDMHVHSASAERYGLKLLLQNIAPGALHDAAERGDQAGCHQNTRVAILKEIMDWIEDPGAREKFIFWLFGPAGSGKTSIAQSIAISLAEKGLLAASFFFWHLAAERNNSRRFITTLAYQLSRFIPAMEDPLFTAIERDPIIFNKTLATQLQILVFDPLKSLLQHKPAPNFPPRPIIIIIDGVDECSPKESQTGLLELLRTAVGEFKSTGITFLFLVSSRSEHEIRSAFMGIGPLSHLTAKLGLDNDYQTEEDIRNYLRSNFDKIRDEHLRQGTKFPSPWPATSDIYRIVEKASGQFVFAATMIKFVESPRINPIHHLNIILGLSSPTQNQRPFTQLDELYETILSSLTVDNLENVLDILTLMILHNISDIAAIEAILGVDVLPELIDMHALVKIAPYTSELSLHHASFADFFVDENRSSKYFFDTVSRRTKLAQCFLRTSSELDTSGLDILQVIKGFVYHSSPLPPNKNFAESLASFDMGPVTRIMLAPEYNPVPHCIAFLKSAKYHGGDQRIVFPRMVDELSTFFKEVLAQGKTMSNRKIVKLVRKVMHIFSLPGLRSTYTRRIGPKGSIIMKSSNPLSSQISNMQDPADNMFIPSTSSEFHSLSVLLLPNITSDALYNAAERGNQPGCLKNTRVTILNEIMDWIQDPGARKRFIFWLYGPAGSGKTSIAQSIAMALAAKGLLAASFFFCHSALNLNNSDRFISTLAYQLSRFIPAMAYPLSTAILKDPAIFSKSLATQLQVLIINPLKAVFRFIPPTPIIFIVDGIDELSSIESQIELLKMLQTTVKELRLIPVLFLVSSRPNYEIRITFMDTNLLGSVTTKVDLNNFSADEDIRLYLTSELDAFWKQKHLQPKYELPSPWPAESDIDCIISKASGLFAFAAVAINFIKSPSANPIDRLNSILNLSNPKEDQQPFALSDELYRTILSAIAGDVLPNVLDILAFLILTPPRLEHGLKMDVQSVGGILGLDIHKTLIDLQSVVYVPHLPDNFDSEGPEKIRLHHASFSDFLLDKSRSCEYYIDSNKGHVKLAQNYLKALQSQQIFGSVKTSGILAAFIHHSRSIAPSEALANGLASADVGIAFGKSMLYEELNPFPLWIDFLDCAKLHGGDRTDVSPRIANQFFSILQQMMEGKWVEL